MRPRNRRRRIVLPDVEAMGSSSLCRAVGLAIPDFQHLHLADLYSAEQKDLLNRAFRNLSRRPVGMLFSSQDCRRDFVEAFPEQAAKARVASFPSLLAFEPPASVRGVPVREKWHHLPERFLLVINQFWRHKNHRLVPEALAILNSRGLEVPVVMAGLPADYRDPPQRSVERDFPGGGDRRRLVAMYDPRQSPAGRPCRRFADGFKLCHSAIAI